MTFPMSRERATTAPTGRERRSYLIMSGALNQMSLRGTRIHRLRNKINGARTAVKFLNNGSGLFCHIKRGASTRIFS